MSYGNYRDRSDALFSTHDGHAVLQANLQELSKEIDRFPEDRLLNTEVDALVKYFVDKFHIDTPVLDLENISASEHEVQIEVRDWGETVRVPGVAYLIEIPFSGDKDVFKIQPAAFDGSPPHADVTANSLKFSIEGRALTAEDVKSRLDRVVASIQKYLGWHTDFWRNFDTQLSSQARSVIDTRRNRLLQQKGEASKLASLGIKIKEKPGDPKTFVPPAVKKRIEPQLPPMRAATPPDPTLDRQVYETILSLIRGAGRSIEQSSSRTRNLDEEALRDMLLVPLNAHFGTATGEAFNYTGKTDVLIKHQGGNLFVAECKFWHGESQFYETIDQLLGYLTWRDTKTAVIIFNRNQGFSAVVNQLKDLPSKHKNYVSGPTRLDDTSYEFKLSLPNDADRQITVTVMGFDLGPKS